MSRQSLLKATGAGVSVFLAFLGLNALAMLVGWSSHLSWMGAVVVGVVWGGLTYSRSTRQGVSSSGTS